MANVTQSDLIPNEKKILKALGTIMRPVYPQRLSEMSGISVEASMQSAFLLEEKGLVRVSEDIDTNYELTKEGYEYATKGLPERQIIEYVNKLDKIPTINEVKIEFGPVVVGIALGWLRKKGWAQIDEGKIYPMVHPEPGDDEETLLQIQAGNVIDDSNKIIYFNKIDSFQRVINDLVKRNLIEVSEDKTRTITITE